LFSICQWWSLLNLVFKNIFQLKLSQFISIFLFFMFFSCFQFLSCSCFVFAFFAFFVKFCHFFGEFLSICECVFAFDLGHTYATSAISSWWVSVTMSWIPKSDFGS
jgi:hypothetical protein